MSNTTGAPYTNPQNLSRPGQNRRAGDDRALFLTEFGGMVIKAYDEAMDYQSMRWIKQITQGKSDTFPIIGRKRDAAEHTPGDQVLGGFIEHSQIEISVDQLVFDAVFIPEIDELLNHIEVRGPYAHQLGQSLGVLQARRIAIMHILASRKTADVGPGQPTPIRIVDANMKTSASSLADAAYKANVYHLENDMSGQKPEIRLPHAQKMLLVRDFGTEALRATAGTGDRGSGTVGQVYGLSVVGTNHIPNANITTGFAKYRGDFRTTVGHIGSSMAVGSLERKSMTIKMKEQDERFGTLILASQLNGHGVLRPGCSIELATGTVA